MKNYYFLLGADGLSTVLGKHSSICITKHEGKNYRSVLIRRIDKDNIELKMREFGGLIFVLHVRLLDSKGCMVQPNMYRHAHERGYAEQVYRTISEVISDTH